MRISRDSVRITRRLRPRTWQVRARTATPGDLTGMSFFSGELLQALDDQQSWPMPATIKLNPHAGDW